MPVPKKRAQSAGPTPADRGLRSQPAGETSDGSPERRAVWAGEIPDDPTEIADTPAQAVDIGSPTTAGGGRDADDGSPSTVVDLDDFPVPTAGYSPLRPALPALPTVTAGSSSSSVRPPLPALPPGVPPARSPENSSGTSSRADPKAVNMEFDMAQFNQFAEQMGTPRDGAFNISEPVQRAAYDGIPRGPGAHMQAESAPAGASTVARVCAQCSTVTADGEFGEGGKWYCGVCWGGWNSIPPPSGSQTPQALFEDRPVGARAGHEVSSGDDDIPEMDDLESRLGDAPQATNEATGLLSSGEQAARAEFFENLAQNEAAGSGVSGQTQDTDASGNTLQSGASAASGSSRSSRSSWLFHKAQGAKNAVGRKLGRAMRGSEPVIPDLDGKMIRKYLFKTEGRVREISLSHASYTWYLKLDQELVASKPHAKSVFKTMSTSVDVEIPPADTTIQGVEPLIATLRMEWMPRNVKWKYSLLVADRDLIPCWTKGQGATKGFVAPEIEQQYGGLIEM